MKVKVLGSKFVIGSSLKYIASVCISYCSGSTSLCAHANVFEPLNLYAAQKTMRWRRILHLDKIASRCVVHWHHTEWEEIPRCIALVIFSSNRMCHHPRSQPCWGVCAPFRTHLNKTWNWHRACCDVWISMSPLTGKNGRLGNINSLWVLDLDKQFHL